MKKLLITGFEPFGGESINPSWEAVKVLPPTIGEYAITTMRLPVVFEEAAQMILKLAEQETFDVIISVGQAGGRSAITPEYVGINLRHATIADNAGKAPQDEVIVKGAPDAHFTTLPVRKMVEAIKEAGLPAQVSYSAGTYVCNDVLFSLLAHFEGSHTRVGFIHIPYCHAQGKEPSIALFDIVRALKLAIQALD
jgi:pyroglutamyl-peptidase